jgi:hypothetical protein
MRSIMKRLIIFVLIILSTVCLNAQFTGSGTYSDPYSGGTLTGSLTWYTASSPVYVSGDLTVGTSQTEGHLIIQAGVEVRSCLRKLIS